MTLTDNLGSSITNPTDQQIIDVLSSLDIQKDGEGFAILSTEELTYTQVYGDQKRGFAIEYQQGSLDKHYVAKREDFTLKEAADCFIAYRDGAIDWDNVGEFEKLEF